MPEALAPTEAFPPRIYSGSVKDVYGVPGRDPYIFLFSDRYSIFDWGEMPDSLAGKGEALAVMGDLFFRHLGRAATWSGWELPHAYPSAWRAKLEPTLATLRRSGLTHHSLGLVNDRGEALPEGSLSRRLAVRALERLPAHAEQQDGKLRWDYSAYQSRPASGLVPLEVVFRFGAPEGSSFLGRMEKIPGYAEAFGFPAKLRAGELFPFPVVEFFTKLEPSDRYLPRAEAAAIAALNPAEIAELEALTLLLALRLRDSFAALGLALWDGKFEFAFTRGAVASARSFQLVDSIGPDELRLLGPGDVHFSKEYLRRAYRGTPWYLAMEEAKVLAGQRGEKDWKKICLEEFKQAPDPLPAAPLEKARLMMPSLVNGLAEEFLGRALYPGVPNVAALCAQLREGA